MKKTDAKKKELSATGVISKTAYRALFLLKLLMKADASKKEILLAFESDIILKKRYRDDTITNTINTLKLAGCIIKRPSPANNYKYSLASHPFKLNISKDNVKRLNSLRQNAAYFYDYKSILNINEFYKKIAKLVDDEEVVNDIFDSAPLLNVDKNLVKKLESHCKNKNTITIEYISGEHGVEPITIVADKLKYENNRLYLWGFNFKYKEYSYLRVDKIKDIKKIALKKEKIKIKTTTVRYKVIGTSAMMFMENDDEKIIESDESSIIVEAKVKNKFHFIQRILFFGPDCTILAPDSFKLEIVEHLTAIRKEYDNA